MKKMFQSIAMSCAALLIAGALVVPAANASIISCVKAKVEEGIDRSEAMQACRDEAAAEHDARMEEIKARMDEAKAAAEAKMEEIKAKIAAKMEKQKAFKDCMDAWEFDIETVNLQEISDQAESCAIEAGLTTAEEIAEMEAKKQEMIEEIEAMKAKIEEAIADAEQKKETMAACLEAARENSEGFDMEAAKASVDACLLEIGIDVEAEAQKIKDKMAEIKEIRAAAKECIDTALADDEMSMEMKREAISDCLTALMPTE